MNFTPLGYDHIVLHVRDQPASMRFYIDVLNCKLDHINEALSLIHLRFGDHMIDLVPGSGASTEARAGLDHFCLSIACDDLDALRQDLAAQGVTLDGDVVTRRGAYGTGPAIYLRDPDGYAIELKPRAA
jgi:catechol 2,3-dioxygenase-like lactoylglutathione lyase family enzyme